MGKPYLPRLHSWVSQPLATQLGHPPESRGRQCILQGSCHCVGQVVNSVVVYRQSFLNPFSGQGLQPLCFLAPQPLFHGQRMLGMRAGKRACAKFPRSRKEEVKIFMTCPFLSMDEEGEKAIDLRRRQNIVRQGHREVPHGSRDPDFPHGELCLAYSVM